MNQMLRDETKMSKKVRAPVSSRRVEANLISTTAHDPAALKDTHFFPAVMEYNEHRIPIKLPMATFAEEVGDVRSLKAILLFLQNWPLTVFNI